jgi:hypothetical protein
MSKQKLTNWPEPLLDRVKATAKAEGVSADHIIKAGAQAYCEKSEAWRAARDSQGP